MSNGKGERAEIEAKLKKFCKRASECKDRFDPERFARMREGRDNEPRGGWAVVARSLGMSRPILPANARPPTRPSTSPRT